MKNYLKTNGIRVAVLVLAVVFLIGLGAAARWDPRNPIETNGYF